MASHRIMVILALSGWGSLAGVLYMGFREAPTYEKCYSMPAHNTMKKTYPSHTMVREGTCEKKGGSLAPSVRTNNKRSL
jgi:hypothetical protein